MRLISRRFHRAAILGGIVLGVSLVTGWLGAQSSPEGLRGAIETEFPGVRWVDVPTLAGWLMGDSPPALIDARTRAEYEVSHLRGAIWVDPDHPDLAALSRLRERRVVVYCSVGYRSARVAQEMTRAGFRDAWNLQGGVFAWANAGKAVFAGGQEVHRVHPYDRVWGRYLRPELHPSTN